MSTSDAPIRIHATGLFLEIPDFPGASGWRAGFTTRRAGGQMGRVLGHFGWEGLPVFQPEQLHGVRVLTLAHPGDVSSYPREGDGVATSCRGVVIAVASADCVPIILFDPLRQAGAVLHAGWRGTRSGIAQEGMRILRENWGCREGDVRAVLGPCIGPCCYRVGEEVIREFEQSGHRELDFVRKEGGSCFLDLPSANRLDLEKAGVAPGRILWVGLCTRCRADLFPSFRREGSRTGRILGFLGSIPAAP